MVSIDDRNLTMTPVKILRCVSYLAPNWFWFYQDVVQALGRRLAIEVQLWQSEFDPLDDPELRGDRIDLAFMCGLPFIRLARTVPEQLWAIAAPVMQASRYQNRPVYFTDVIVQAESSVMTLADLSGKVFCYNDPGSNSGYHLLLHRLQKNGYSEDFFGSMLQSGSHQTSIRWVTEGIVDYAAIDSTVLEEELSLHPELAERLRVIEAIGPCPIPPIVVASRLSNEWIQAIQSVLLHPDSTLQVAMQAAKVSRYVSVKTEDYQGIIPAQSP
jgi:phosphonate transport system substrate-binding protein